MPRSTLIFAIALMWPQSAVLAQDAAPVPAESIKLAALPGAPPGVLSAVISGDLAKEGLYVLRNKWPAETWLGPHDHGPAHRIYTILEGELWWGFGDTIDESRMVRLGPGSVAVTGPDLPPHYFRTGPEGMVANVVAEGPFVTNMVTR